MELLVGVVNKLNQVFNLLAVLAFGWVLGFGWVNIDEVSADGSLVLSLVDLFDGGEKGVIFGEGYLLLQVNDNWIGIGKTHTGWLDIPVAFYGYLTGLIYTISVLAFAWDPSEALRRKITKALNPLFGEVDEGVAAETREAQKEHVNDTNASEPLETRMDTNQPDIKTILEVKKLLDDGNQIFALKILRQNGMSLHDAKKMAAAISDEAKT